MVTMPRRTFSKTERQILSRYLKSYPKCKLPIPHTRRLLKCTIRVYTHQRLSRRKENCFCYSRVFGKAEQKMSSQHRELCGIISILQTYESYIIGSPLPLYIYCDHRLNLFLWSRKGQLSHRFFKYQVVLAKFNNLKIISTPGSNLVFPGLLSRNLPVNVMKKYQLEHKTIANDTKFILDNGEQICEWKQILFIPDLNHEIIYEEIPDEVSALNDSLETSEWLDLYKGNFKNNLLKDLVKAKVILKTKQET